MYTLEEFPPRRESRKEETPEVARRRKRAKREPREPPEPREPRRDRTIGLGWLPFAAILAIGASAGGAGAFLWAERRVATLEGALMEARTELQTTHSSLRTLWETTTRLDAVRGQGQDFLRDSLASVQQFVDSEVNKLWQTAYLENRERLDTDAAHIAETASR
jgi:hypothetical protein